MQLPTAPVTPPPHADDLPCLFRVEVPSVFGAPFGSSFLFRVTVGPFLLGSFTSCDGLGCSVEMQEVWEGGVNDHPWRIPTRMTYSNITFTRPLGRDSALSWGWLSSQVIKPVPTVGEIAALDADRKPIVRWWLQGVYPVSWKGPSFSASDSRAVTETLEIAHNGFISIPV
ncbi:phage tail protein [Streptomyces goshikiensis]|uniref:phage tail protein n=1 Tax=Streptomyces goshikiensis TaxID=1942 RepID=UPI0036A16BE9